MLAANQQTRHQYYDTISTFITDAVLADSLQYQPTFLQEIEALLHEWRIQDNNTEGLDVPTTSTDQDHPMKRLNREELAGEICQKLQGMVESLGEELTEYGAVADIQANFNGTLHCEASLASLLDPQIRRSLAGNSDLQVMLDCTKVD